MYINLTAEMQINRGLKDNIISQTKSSKHTRIQKIRKKRTGIQRPNPGSSTSK